MLIQVDVRGETVEVEAVHYDEYPRGKDYTCAFCHGDPCGEYSNDSHIYRLMHNEDGSWSGESTCPICDGRPT